MRESLKTDSWEQAEQRLQELKESPAFSLSAPKSVRKAVEEYVANAEVNLKLADETVAHKKRTLFPFVAFCEERGKKHLQQIGFEDLTEFRTTWRGEAAGAAKKLEAIKGFFTFCMNARWIKENPASALKRPKVPPNPTLPFTREQVDKMRAACDLVKDIRGRFGQPVAYRMRAMLLVLRYTGLRIRDAMTLDDTKVLPGRIFLHQQLKTGEPVYVPVPDFVYAALRDLPQRMSERYFFWTGNGKLKTGVGTWQRDFQRLFKLAGINYIPEAGVPMKYWKPRLVDGKRVKAHLHMFRDTFAVELLLNGVPMEDVQILLGHTSIRTTEKNYAPWVRARQERLEEHIRAAWGERDEHFRTPLVQGGQP